MHTADPAIGSVIAPGAFIAERCHYCSRQLPAWRTHQLTGHAQRICDDCLDWHNKAIAVLAGEGVCGCQACGASWDFLRNSQIGVEVRLYVVPRDGIYQVLCATCIRKYLPMRADLYGGTRFGAEVLKQP